MLSRPQNCSESAQAAQSRIAEACPAAGRSVDSVTLLAVSKGQSSAAIDSAARAGIEHFGENFLQESLPKIEALAGRELTWHFIGRLQANKTRPVAENFAWVHAVDRLKIAERLSAQRPFHAPPLNVCLQLHVGGEASKGGVEAAEIAPLAAAVTRPAAPPPARPHVHAAGREPMSTRQRAVVSRDPPGVRLPQRARPRPRHPVDGHQRGLRSGHRRRRHHGAHRHGDLRPARYATAR